MVPDFELEDIHTNLLYESKINYKISDKFKAYTLSNLDKIPQLHNLNKSLIDDMRIVGKVLPFKTNNYILGHLIDWKKAPNDPIFRLVFPQKKMLLPHHYKKMKRALNTDDKEHIKEVANNIRLELNPNPAGQKQYNIPLINGKSLHGIQHKYRETVLLFPTAGQTCHAYCTFCFRWSQFVTISGKHKFTAKNVNDFISYLQENPTVTDVLVTGGDPMIMRAKVLESILRPILEADIPHLTTIRIGSKSLSYWPRRFIDDPDTENILSLFQDITDSDLNIAFMAHFNHVHELKSTYLELAVKNLQNSGVLIRTQSPLLNYINASSDDWLKMWSRQLELGMIPYYMFIARDTGAQHYFSVPLVKAWRIFREAYSKISGLGRTVRGPSMSCTPGKISVEGVTSIQGKKVISLKFIQGRNPDWVKQPFFAKYNSKATWIDELEPAFSKEFFYEKELKNYLKPYYEIKKNKRS